MATGPLTMDKLELVQELARQDAKLRATGPIVYRPKIEVEPHEYRTLAHTPDAKAAGLAAAVRLSDHADQPYTGTVRLEVVAAGENVVVLPDESKDFMAGFNAALEGVV